MTLSERNTFFKAGIVFCAVCTLLIIAVFYLIIPHSLSLVVESVKRPAISFLTSNFIAVLTCLAGSVLFSFVGMLLIHYFFERTSSPEILYIAIFTISFSFEVIRLILPLRLIFNFPSFYVSAASRILLFARFFGIFSLFAAGLCAAGLDVQKTRTIILAIFIAVMVITMSVPIDSLNWDTSLNMINGYASTFIWIELIASVTTIVSFLITAKIRRSKEYIYVALGIMLALIGRAILISTDNWAGPIPGILLLSFGIGFLCSKLHKIHLWL